MPRNLNPLQRLAGLATGTPQRPWRTETVLLACSLFWLPLANLRFFNQALAGHVPWEASSWLFALALGVALVAIHYIVLALLAWGPWFRAMVTLLLLVAAGAAHFINAYGVYLDPSMMRNALRTDWRETRELLGWQMLWPFVLGVLLPGWWVWRVRLPRRSFGRALVWRLATMALALLALVGAVLAVFQPLASLTRNHRELRYLITPANVLWSTAVQLRGERRASGGALLPVGRDAELGPSFKGRTRPALVVFVVGETARAANWGLNGYARQTTPQLAGLPVIPFAQVTSCGTDTESSLPCMFAAIGRRDYDERRIRGSENLLHVLRSAGVGVQWRDNQSGCKGLCDGFPNVLVSRLAPPGLCGGDAGAGSCYDEGLLHGLEQELPALRGAQFLVLHQLGNHGPAYHRRAPAAFKRFQPACEFDDLSRCSVEEIVNAYDNALLYTDHVLALLIARLQALAPQLDSALVYVSDHGESLGEHRLFLHGMPFAIAPDVQTRVPMLMWLSPGFTQARGLDTACIARRATQAASHDHLFHTLLGLLDVRTSTRDAALDLVQACATAPAKP